MIFDVAHDSIGTNNAKLIIKFIAGFRRGLDVGFRLCAILRDESTTSTRR